MSIFQNLKIHWIIPSEVHRNYPYGGRFKGEGNCDNQLKKD